MLLDCFTHLSRYIIRSVALLVLLMAGTFGVAAQPASGTPLVIVANGIIYQFDGNFYVPYSACQPDEVIRTMRGADGRIAFTTVSLKTNLTLDAFDFGEYTIVPDNLWVCDTNTSTLTLVSGQADNFTEVIGVLNNNLVLHSDPAWSGDGRYMAWTELRRPEFKFYVGVYDVTTGTSIVRPLVTSSEGYVDVPVPLQVHWVNDGFVLLDTRHIDTGSGSNLQVDPVLQTLRYDNQANRVGTTDLISAPGVNTYYFPFEVIVVTTNQGDFLAFNYQPGGWYLVDPISGQQTPMIGQPELVSRDVANSVVLQFTVSEQINRSWQLQGTDARFNNTVFDNNVVISPDGSQVAVFLDNQVDIYSRSGQPQALDDYFPLTTGIRMLNWGDAVYRISVSQIGAPQIGASPVGVQQPGTQQPGSQQPDGSGITLQCEGTQVSRLREGFYGRVTDNGFANNLRSEPSLTAELLAQIQGGETFTIITGPVCAEGYAWWEISYQGQRGWTVEGNNRTYWLEPYNQ